MQVRMVLRGSGALATRLDRMGVYRIRSRGNTRHYDGVR